MTEAIQTSVDNLTFAPRPEFSGFFDLTGQRFGKVVVLGFKGRERQHSRWWCKCDCGNICIKTTNKLHTPTNPHRPHHCGCITSRPWKFKHGRGTTPEYYFWRNMLNRCYYEKSEKYPDYGARGITVCDRWRKSFVHFFEDMGERPSSRHTIERINNDGNYEPSNCKWATPKEQGRNRRSTVYITLNNKTLCLTDWAKEAGIKFGTFQSRRKAGWCDECALTLPIGTSKNCCIHRPRPVRDNPLIPCSCGCGTRLHQFDSRWRPRRYVAGHNNYADID